MPIAKIAPFIRGDEMPKKPITIDVEFNLTGEQLQRVKEIVGENERLEAENEKLRAELDSVTVHYANKEIEQLKNLEVMLNELNTHIEKVMK